MSNDKVTNTTNCVFIGINAGRDIIEGDRIIIIGDNIVSLDKSQENVLFIGDKIAIGTTLLGVPIDLKEVIDKFLMRERDKGFNEGKEACRPLITPKDLRIAEQSKTIEKLEECIGCPGSDLETNCKQSTAQAERIKELVKSLGVLKTSEAKLKEQVKEWICNECDTVFPNYPYTSSKTNLNCPKCHKTTLVPRSSHAEVILLKEQLTRLRKLLDKDRIKRIIQAFREHIEVKAKYTNDEFASAIVDEKI